VVKTPTLFMQPHLQIVRILTDGVVYCSCLQSANNGQSFNQTIKSLSSSWWPDAMSPTARHFNLVATKTRTLFLYRMHTFTCDTKQTYVQHPLNKHCQNTSPSL